MNETAARPPRPAADWAKAADGIGMAGFAVFLLMNTMGHLPWSFWLDAISLWPVLLMSAGLKIAFEKSRAPWLVLLGPVLVLGSLAWLASGRRPELPMRPGEPETLARPAGMERAEIDASLAGARLRLALATDLPADRLLEGSSAADREHAQLSQETDGATARIRLDSGTRHGFVFVPRARERWDLRLPAELPLRVRVRGAGVGGELDLIAGTVGGLTTEGVFMGIAARLPAPRTDTEIRLKGVFNSYTLVVPEGTPVRVHGPGLPLNAKGRGLAGRPGRPGYDVSVEGVFSAVDVRADRTIRDEPPGLPERPTAAPPAPERPRAEAEPGPRG